MRYFEFKQKKEKDCQILEKEKAPALLLALILNSLPRQEIQGKTALLACTQAQPE